MTEREENKGPKFASFGTKYTRFHRLRRDHTRTRGALGLCLDGLRTGHKISKSGVVSYRRRDFAQTLHEMIQQADPEMKYAFTPEKARELMDRLKGRDGEKK